MERIETYTDVARTLEATAFAEYLPFLLMREMPDEPTLTSADCIDAYEMLEECFSMRNTSKYPHTHNSFLINHPDKASLNKRISIASYILWEGLSALEDVHDEMRLVLMILHRHVATYSSSQLVAPYYRETMRRAADILDSTIGRSFDSNTKSAAAANQITDSLIKSCLDVSTLTLAGSSWSGKRNLVIA